MKIQDRVLTPGGLGNVILLEGATDIHTVWVDMDYADSGYHWMRISNEDWDGEGLLTVNKYPIEEVSVYVNPEDPEDELLELRKEL